MTDTPRTDAIESQVTEFALQNGVAAHLARGVVWASTVSGTLVKKLLIEFADIRERELAAAGAEIERLHAEAIPERMTPAMLHAAQKTEMGAFIASNWAGAYDCFQEFWTAAIDAARRER